MLKKNWAVGVKKNIMLAGPIPINSNPLMYIKRGTSVINPAKNKYKDNVGLSNPKTFVLLKTRELNKIIIRGTNRDIRKDIKSRFVLIKIEKLSIDIKFPTKILVSKFWLGKNNRPKIKPSVIE